jgi:hypothetical protein
MYFREGGGRKEEEGGGRRERGERRGRRRRRREEGELGEQRDRQLHHPCHQRRVEEA